jgi:LDH2 family malate/lactate/ureidoglycolate dehydrogenase
MAMDLAISKAASSGIGYVGVRDSNHFGAAGYYANMAAMRSMIGLAMSNGNPNMTVPGARGSVVGNNPFACAVPFTAGRSVFMDIATSTVASSKVWSAKFLGKQISDTWIVDEDGIPTTDLSKYPSACSLQPMGGHIGYCLAVMIEILSAVLTGAKIIDEVESWLLNLHDRTKIGHCFIAINVNAIMPGLQFDERMERLVRGIREAPKAKGAERILLPGEGEWEKRESALKYGMILPEDVLASLFALAEDEGLDLASIFE